MLETTILLTTLTIYSLSSLAEMKAASAAAQRELNFKLKESKRERERSAANV